MTRRPRYSLASKSTQAAAADLSPPPTNNNSQPTTTVNNKPTTTVNNKRLRPSSDSEGSEDGEPNVNQSDINQALKQFNQDKDTEMTDEEDPEKEDESEEEGNQDRSRVLSPPQVPAPQRQTPIGPLVSRDGQNQIPTHMTGSVLQTFNQLAALAELDEHHLVIGRLLSPAIAREDQFMALMVSVLAARQEMSSQINELTLQLDALKVAVSNSGSSVGRGGVAWEETSELRQCVRLLASKTILSGSIQAYTATQDRDGDQDILPHSLYALVMKGILGNPAKWRNRLLPARYGRDPDPLCAKALHKMIKNVLKEVRKEFEGLLLTHIQLPNRVNALSNSNVPLLETVIVKLYQKERVLTGGRVRVREEILKDVDHLRESRYAYLRMQVIHWGLNRDAYENKSFWAVVDQNLERLRSESTRHRYAYFILVLQDDFDRINGGQTFEQLKGTGTFELPSGERVQQTIDSLEETFGSNVLPDEAAHVMPEPEKPSDSL